MQLHRLRPLAATAAAVLTTLGFAACGSSSSTTTTTGASTSATTTAAAATHYPLRITNCGTAETFTSAPTRAVANDINTSEDMFALGLQSKMVGIFGADGDGPEGHPYPAQYESDFKAVKDASSNYFTLEPLLGLRPDFLFAGWFYGFNPGTRLSPQGLSKFGIKSLVLDESCAQVDKGVTSVSLDETYRDIENLGAIFDVNQRATALVNQMKARIAAVQQKVAGLKPVTVFDYDSGNSAPVTGPGLAMPTPIIQAAGGMNIFASLKKSWSNVSWEQVVKAQPQCIIINDYGTPTAAQKLKFLRTFPATRDLPAVKNDCILPLAYDEVVPGVRNVDAVVALAKLLHPTAFGLPARVS